MITKQIGADNVAAIIIEPVLGEGGFIEPAKGFLPADQQVRQGQRHRLRRGRDPVRLLPHRPVVRVRGRGHRPGPDHHRQGHRGRSAARRRDRPRRDHGRRARGRPGRHLRRQPGGLRRCARRDRDDEGARPQRQGEEHRGDHEGPPGARWPRSSTSSATSAAAARMIAIELVKDRATKEPNPEATGALAKACHAGGPAGPDLWHLRQRAPLPAPAGHRRGPAERGPGHHRAGLRRRVIEAVRRSSAGSADPGEAGVRACEERVRGAMTGRGSGCRTPTPCRTVSPDERNTPPTGDCGRHRDEASPAPPWSCPRAHTRSFRLRNSSPIGWPPAPNPPGRATTRSDGRLGTTPPVPGRPTFLPLGPPFCALLFALLTWQVAADGPLRRADERLATRSVQPRAERAAELLADLGNIAVALPSSPPSSATPPGAPAAPACPAGGCPPSPPRCRWPPSRLVVPIKETVARPGPAVMGPGTGFYPSGHTTTAAVAYGACLLLLLPCVRGAYARRELVIGYTVLNAPWPRSDPARLPLAAGRRGGWCLSVVLLYVMCAVWAGRAPRG